MDVLTFDLLFWRSFAEDRQATHELREADDTIAV